MSCVTLSTACVTETQNRASTPWTFPPSTAPRNVGRYDNPHTSTSLFSFHLYSAAALYADPLFMCSTRCTSRPLTLRCAAAPAKTSPARFQMKTGQQIFLLYGLHIHVHFALPYFKPSRTDYVCLCRRGVPGWRTAHVMTVWKQQWEQ